MNNDLISRQAAIELIKNNSYTIKHGRNDVEKGMTLYGIIQALEYLPAVQPKTGRWEPLFGTTGKVFKCSECGAVVTVAYECFKDGCYYDYCPNCGAKMKGETE